MQKIIDGRTDLIFDYVESGQNPTSTDEHDRPLIIWAAYYGDVTAIKYLLSKGETLDKLGPNYDLNGAAFHGHWQLCQYLLEEGADPNWKLPGTGETPLHSCMSKANSFTAHYIVQLLLHYGANPNIQTLPRKETGAFMRDAYTRKETSLHRAAAFGASQTIKLLLDAGADKSMKDMHGESPLSWASWHLRPGEILLLLAYGQYKIHPLHVEQLQSDHGAGPGGGTMRGLLGEVHI